MSQNNNLPLKLGLALGATLGVVVISIGIIRYQTGMIIRGDQTLSFVYWIIFATAIFCTVFWFRKLEPHSFSFNRTIKIGLFAGLVSGAMYTIYIVILNNYIDTDLSAKIIQFNEEQLALGKSALSEEDVSDSSKIMSMNSAMRGFFYMFVCMTFGIAYSFASTVIAKRFSINSEKQ